MKNACWFTILAVLIFGIFSDTFGQNRSDQQSGSANQTTHRFVILQNDVHFIRLDRKTGQSWILQSSRTENKNVWVPLNDVKNEAEAKKWLQEEQKERTNKESKLDRKKFAAWANEVLLQPEYGKASNAVRRWKTPPSISVFGGNEKHKKLTIATLKKLNAVLAQTRFGKLKLAKANDQEADIRVYFTAVKNFAMIAKNHKFQIPQYNEGFFALKWDSKNALLEGQVLIAVDRLEGQQLEHILLEEITQALGPTNDSNMFRTSIFFGGRSFPTELSPRDQILLKMLYTNLRPNDKKSHVERAVKNTFHKLEKYKSKE